MLKRTVSKSAHDLLQYGAIFIRPFGALQAIRPQNERSRRTTSERSFCAVKAARPSQAFQIVRLGDANPVDTALVAQQFDRHGMGDATVAHGASVPMAQRTVASSRSRIQIRWQTSCSHTARPLTATSRSVPS